MANKKVLWGMLALALAFGLMLTGCATISKENKGTFSTINVPNKDFTSLGLVFTENVVENNKGEVFTYYALLKEAQKLGGDGMVNVTIDVKREGKKFGLFYLNPKETWYGSATAIKYTDSLSDTGTTTATDADGKSTTTTTTTTHLMSGSGASSSGGGLGGLLGGDASASGSTRKKFLGIF